MSALALGGGLWGIAGASWLGGSMKIAIGVLCAVWLVVGATAAQQRHYYGNGVPGCDAGATFVTTLAVGPLNYQGINPKVSCPEPSA
jgi:disulfide bond formation protein DsbB